MKLVAPLFTFILLISSAHVYASTWAQRGALIVDDKKDHKNKSWIKLAPTERESAKELISIIETTKMGEKLVARAKLKARRDGKSLYDVIKSGDVSLTDTTLIRKFSQHDPFNISYHAKSVVLIDKTHSVKDAVLDLVHELTHYTFKEPFNPYKKDFKISDFMKNTIEGRGGEVEAFLVECRVGREIYGKSPLSAQCQAILDETGEPSKLLAVKEFYKLGSFHKKFLDLSKKKGLNVEEFKHVSRDSGVIISSAWGSPYPMAILDEYTNIMEKVCRNDERRLAFYGTDKSRLPASIYTSYAKAKKDFSRRCE
jgi:hypothetical protein